LKNSETKKYLLVDSWLKRTKKTWWI
jgi:hypothetical protein